MKLRDGVYKVGVIISFLGLSGLAEAITTRGSREISILFFVVGLVMCLVGYTK